MDLQVIAFWLLQHSLKFELKSSIWQSAPFKLNYTRTFDRWHGIWSLCSNQSAKINMDIFLFLRNILFKHLLPHSSALPSLLFSFSSFIFSILNRLQSSTPLPFTNLHKILKISFVRVLIWRSKADKKGLEEREKPGRKKEKKKKEREAERKQ